MREKINEIGNLRKKFANSINMNIMKVIRTTIVIKVFSKVLGYSDFMYGSTCVYTYLIYERKGKTNQKITHPVKENVQK